MDPSVLFQDIAERVRRADVFDTITQTDRALECRARGAEASYRLELDGDQLWVSLVSPDRWLSESIEADLLNSGDDLAELIEEELVELGYEGDAIPFSHYRSEDLLYTFRSPVPRLEPELAATCLLAYEACFRNLGDMSPDE